MRTRYLPLAQQRGAATLIVAIILLLALTLATFSAARIGVTEQRSVANDVRAKQAFWVAQAGVEQGIAFLNANKALISSRSASASGPPPIEVGWEVNPYPHLRRWTLCSGSSEGKKKPPCGDGDTTHAVGDPSWASYNLLPTLEQVSDDYIIFNLDFLVPKSQLGDPPPINPTVIVTATVQSAAGDRLRGLTGVGTDVLRVSQMVKGYDTLVGLSGSDSPSIDAPLMVKGSVSLGTGVSVWGKVSPNLPYAPSVPFPGLGTLSIWSRDTTNLTPPATPPARTCASSLPPPDPLTCPTPGAVIHCVLHPLDTDVPSPGCAGVAGAGTFTTVPRAFPPDLFYYVFGVADISFQRVRNDATVLTDCSTLGTQPSGLYWVDGDCTITTHVGGTAPVGATPARSTAPVTLVVNGGGFTLNAGVHFWGTVFLRGGPPPPAPQIHLPTVGVAPVLHGALIVDPSSEPTRNLTVTAGGILNLVYDVRVFSPGARAGGFAKVLGGWRDAAQ